MSVPIHRRRLTGGATVLTPRFHATGPLAEKSALVTLEFDPPINAEVPLPGATWSPSLGAFYQYLPPTTAASTHLTKPVSIPRGVRAVTLRVQPWQSSTSTPPVSGVGLLEGTQGAERDRRETPVHTPESDSAKRRRALPSSSQWVPENRDQFSVTHHLDGLPLYFRETGRPPELTDSLLVLMPAALSGARRSRRGLTVSRFTWAHLWPTSEVIAVADPSLQEAEGLNGAWFIHPDHDIPAAIASLAAEKAEERDIPTERIMFYGSSLGGFGAIAAASTLAGARAAAEVPQIYFRNWIHSAIDDVEKHLIHMPIGEFELRHPEQLSLPDRLLHSGRIPGTLLITNSDELNLDEQTEFAEWARASELPKSGPVEQFITDRVSGHQVLDKATISWLVRP